MHILPGESLQARNSLALQAQAQAFVRVDSNNELLAALEWARQQQLPVIPLGEGSNVVLAGDLHALVVCIAIPGVEVLEDGGKELLLRVNAGENWHGLVRQCLAQGWYGLENLALIPGTVGAAPIQNIGAYGVELGPLVEKVHCVNISEGKSRVLSRAECEFGYRDSVFKQRLRDQLVIRAVDLKLSREPRPALDYPALAHFLEQQKLAEITPQAVFEAVVNIRRNKLPDPAREPNAGSFFKNPVIDAGQARDLARQFPGLPEYPQPRDMIKLPAAWLIDYCGWKGYRQEGLGVHPEHALVIVNYGSNNGKKLLTLAAEIARSVLDTFGIELEIEPRVYGLQP